MLNTSFRKISTSKQTTDKAADHNKKTALKTPQRLLSADLTAPVLGSGNLDLLNSFAGVLTIVSHPAFWRSAQPEVRKLAKQTYMSGLQGDTAELAIKRDMLHICYGKGFLFEAQFEYTLLKAKNNRTPILVTVDFEQQTDQQLQLSKNHQKFLATYLNWCFAKYSIGNIFIVPTKKKSGLLLSQNVRADVIKACESRANIMLHGGIIDQCLLQTSRDLFYGEQIAERVALDDRFCYSQGDPHIQTDRLKAKHYFNDGVTAWGDLGITHTGTHRCNETIHFRNCLPEVKIDY